MKDQQQEETTGTAVAVRTEMHIALDAIDAKLKEIKDVTESTLKTNGEFRFNPQYTANAAINIHKTTELKVLVGVLGAVKGHKDKYDEAATILGLSEYPAFEWCGYSYESWEHDIKMRSTIITHHDRKQQLINAKKELEQFMTQEDRLKLVLGKIGSIIK